MGAVGKPSGLLYLWLRALSSSLGRKMGKLEASPLNLGPIPSPSLVSGKHWLYEFPGETTEKNGQSQADQLGSEDSLKKP